MQSDYRTWNDIMSMLAEDLEDTGWSDGECDGGAFPLKTDGAVCKSTPGEETPLTPPLIGT